MCIRDSLRRTIKRSCPEYPWYDHGTGTFGYRVGAVSYTHLDVYKRQEIEGDISVENGENPKSAFRTESIRGQPRGERAYLETVADSRDPVSYTHLDVYKRQAQPP